MTVQNLLRFQQSRFEVMYPTLAVSSSLYKDEEEICANRYSTHAYNKATEKKKLCGKGTAERPRCRWEVNIKMDIKLINYEPSYDNV